MIFNHQRAPGRNAAIRAGWNDAAWGRPHRDVEAAQAPWYERGYAGGLVFREPLQPAPSVATDRTHTSITDPYAGRRATSMKLSRAIYLIFGLIEALLAIRFVLKALGANAWLLVRGAWLAFGEGRSASVARTDTADPRPLA